MADDLRHNADVSTPDLPPREKLLTVEEFVRLGELGFLNEPGKHELWDGRIMMAPPPGMPHMDRERRTVARLILAIHAAGLEDHFGVIPSGGIQIGDRNLRSPDIMVARLPLDMDRKFLSGEAAALVIEVAHSSLPDDLSEKRGKYAAAGIREYWVIDVEGRRLFPFRDPKAGDYPDCTPLQAGAAISPLFAPQIELKIADLV